MNARRLLLAGPDDRARAVDDPALERALAVLQGDADLPGRPETDEFFATDATVRDAVHEVYGTGP